MTDAVDTSKEAVERLERILEDGGTIFAQAEAARKLRALLAERDKLRRELEEALEMACAVVDAHGEYDQALCCDGRMCGCQGASVHDAIKHHIRALKARP